MTLRAVVWGENVHEQISKVVLDIYPDGRHGAKGGLAVIPIQRKDAQATTLRASIGPDMMQLKLVEANYACFIKVVQTRSQVAPDLQRGAVLQKVLDTAVTFDRDQSRDLLLA